MNKYGVSWKKPTTWMVIGFVVFLAFMFTQESKASTAMEIAPGTTFVAGNRYTGGWAALTERVLDEKIELGVGLTTALECIDNCRRGDSENNAFIYAERVVKYKSIEAGIGFSYWHNTTAAWDSHTPFALHLGWNANEHFELKWRHFSTAGSSTNNGGLDMLTVGWRF